MDFSFKDIYTRAKSVVETDSQNYTLVGITY